MKVLIVAFYKESRCYTSLMLNLLGGTLVMSLLIVGVWMVLMFILSLFLRNNGIADVAWGLGFIFLALSSFVLNESGSLRAIIVTSLVLVWGLRLSLRIFLKNYGKPEDSRYRAWREAWGSSIVIRSFFQIYLLQGLLVVALATP